MISDIRQLSLRMVLPLAAVVGCPAMPVGAQTDAAALMRQAADAYAASQWTPAIEKFEQLRAMGVSDPALDYNLGTAYAQAGDKGRAVLHLLRAWRRTPRDRAVLENLKIVAPDIASQVAVFPIPPLEWLYRQLSLNGWTWLAGGMTLLACSLWMLTFGRPGLAARAAWIGRLARIALVAAVVGHFFAAMRYYDEIYVPHGVVVGEETYPHPSPNETSTPFDWTLPAGTVIRIGHAGVEGWIKAIYGGGNEVFIREADMMKL